MRKVARKKDSSKQRSAPRWVASLTARHESDGKVYGPLVARAPKPDVVVTRKRKRVFNPVALTTVVEASTSHSMPGARDSDYEIPGRHGVQWQYKDEGLVKVRRRQGRIVEAASIDESPLTLTSVVIPKLIDHMLPLLAPHRKRMLAERLAVIRDAKLRARQREERRTKGYAQEDEADKRARRLTRNEKGALGRLKKLLRKR